MGIISSYLGGNQGSAEPDPVTGLTPKEKNLVESTWSLVKKDISGNGVKLFLIYFKNFPEYQNYFPFRNVPLEELANNIKLKGHATNVAYALSAIIDNLNSGEVLVDLLEKNGQSHVKRKIPEKAYWDLKISLLELLEKQLGSKFTKEAREAWDKTLTVAMSVIVKQFHKPTE